MALKKFCSHPGCNKIIDATARYCKRHERAAVASRAESAATYDREHRDKKATAFYHSKAWTEMRKTVLTRDCNIDVYIYVTEGRVVPATMVHHIVELREDYGKRLALDNLISLSASTHEGVVDKAYRAGAESKRQMQEELREAIRTFQNGVRG